MELATAYARRDLRDAHQCSRWDGYLELALDGGPQADRRLGVAREVGFVIITDLANNGGLLLRRHLTSNWLTMIDSLTQYRHQELRAP